MSRTLPARLPLAASHTPETSAGRSIFAPQAAPRLAMRAHSVISAIARDAHQAWRVIPGAMGLPALIVPNTGEIIP